MTKEEILKMAEELYQEAFDANSYYLLMTQFGDNSKKYNSEFHLSPAFYSVVFNALQSACFMEIAKLFEKDKKVFSIGSLVKECKNNLSFFPEYRAIKEYEFDGQKYTFQIPYQHTLKPNEECFFKDIVNSQREIFKLFNVNSTDKSPVMVNLKFPEFLELYYKRFCGLSKKMENIRVQRNKIYAHNDTVKLSGSENILKKNPVYYADLRELIDFALDATKLIIACLTDVCRADSYNNINDWENTLMFAKLGLKYRDYDNEQQMKEFKEQLRSQKKE